MLCMYVAACCWGQSIHHWSHCPKWGPSAGPCAWAVILLRKNTRAGIFHFRRPVEAVYLISTDEIVPWCKKRYGSSAPQQGFLEGCINTSKVVFCGFGFTTGVESLSLFVACSSCLFWPWVWTVSQLVVQMRFVVLFLTSCCLWCGLSEHIIVAHKLFPSDTSGRLMSSTMWSNVLLDVSIFVISLILALCGQNPEIIVCFCVIRAVVEVLQFCWLVTNCSKASRETSWQIHASLRLGSKTPLTVAD